MNKWMYGHLSAFMTIFIWGTTFISTKILLTSLTSIEILFIRFLIGYVTLWLVYPQRISLKQKQHEYYFLAAGLCGITLYYLFENIALTYTLASHVGVIISIAPFFTAILAYFFSDEKKLNIRFFIGFIIAIIGVCMISFKGDESLSFNLTGDFLAIIAAIIWAIYSTLTQKIASFQYNTIQSTRHMFFYGLIFMLPFLLIMDFHPKISTLIHPLIISNLLFLGLGASALCFVTWNLAVKILGPVKTSVYIYIVPVITAVTSFLILDEAMNQMTIIGIILTLIGLWLSEKRTKENLDNELCKL